jgi:hypothetical protein
MKTYQVYVQEKLYKNITGDNIQKVLSQVSQDIKQNLVPDFDSSKPQNIKLVPANEVGS